MKWLNRGKWSKRICICICAVDIACFAGGFAVLGKSYYKSDEDLRFSFTFSTQGKVANTAYLFSNVGKQSAQIYRIGLLEVVSNRKDAQPAIRRLCDANFDNTLTALQGKLAQPGMQIGGDGERSAIYKPKKISVDGNEWSQEVPISVESGKNNTIHATFELLPEHANGFDTLAICPFVVTLDAAARRKASVCMGFAHTQFAQFGPIPVIYESHQQFRLLPHTAGTKCELGDGNVVLKG
jgi:hypothetical protein